MKNKILYIGNNLKKHGVTVTTIDTLGEKLKDDFDIVLKSDKKNKLIRLIDIILSIFFTRNINKVLIDTYSTSAFYFAFLSAVSCWILRINYIPIIHGGNFKRRICNTRYLVNFFIKNSFAVVTPSNFLAEIIKKELNYKTIIIPNSLDDYSYLNKGPITNKPINLLWVRSFHKIYNPVLAIEILNKLHLKGYKDSKLCMVGPSKDDSILKVHALINKYKLENFVEITGLLSKNNWIKKAKHFNFFLNTTTIDNTPVSVMEAMAVGLVVISSDVGGIPYLIQNNYNGILVEKNNSDKFVNSIIELNSDLDKFNFIRLNAVKKSYDWYWEKIKIKWMKLLNTKI